MSISAGRSSSHALFGALQVVVLALVLSACGYTTMETGGPPSGREPEYKVGKPYKVGGRWYTPAEDPYYDVVGYASWYGAQFHGKRTANGEIFDMNGLSAAHTTLPMPSYVRVTNLSNGRSVVLRINDRGPFAQNRVIDVSRRAAQLLGFEKKGIQRVRVQSVRSDGTPFRQAGRSENESRQAAAGATARAVPSGTLFVQVGSFSSHDAARSLVPRLKGLGPVLIQTAMVNGKTVYRVRIGPYGKPDDAYTVLESVRARGFMKARVFTAPTG